MTVHQGNNRQSRQRQARMLLPMRPIQGILTLCAENPSQFRQRGNDDGYPNREVKNSTAIHEGKVERVEQHLAVERVLERGKGKVTSCRSLPPIASYETEKKINIKRKMEIVNQDLDYPLSGEICPYEPETYAPMSDYADLYMFWPRAFPLRRRRGFPKSPSAPSFQGSRTPRRGYTGYTDRGGGYQFIRGNRAVYLGYFFHFASEQGVGFVKSPFSPRYQSQTPLISEFPACGDDRWLEPSAREQAPYTPQDYSGEEGCSNLSPREPLPVKKDPARGARLATPAAVAGQLVPLHKRAPQVEYSKRRKSKK
nr:hypothetical protein CTI12_AA035400, chloroplastic [Tanacetum cinerariifolium]